MKNKYILSAFAVLIFLNTQAQFIDDIESYDVGSIFNDRWTTWNGIDDGIQNAEVSTDFALSGTKSIKISPGAAGPGPQDAVLDFQGVASTGKWNVKWFIYIPTGQSAYFNVQGNTDPSAEANMQFLNGNITFNSENSNPGFVIDEGTFNQVDFPHDQWFEVGVEVDLDQVEIRIFIDNEILIDTPIFTFYDRFDGIDFFSIDDFSLFYIDDVVFSQGPLVFETVPPVANCVAPFTIELDSNGQAFINAQSIDDGSTDNSGQVNLSIDIQGFSCLDAGTDVDVTLTVTDPSGNTDSCITTITIVDNIAPSLDCMNNITLMLDVMGMATIDVNDIENSSFDACGIDTKVLDITTFNCTNLGQNTVNLTVTDVNGNASMCTATVTIVPFFLCPPDIVVSTDVDSCSVIGLDLGNPIASEACAMITSVLNDAPAVFQVGATTVIWTVMYSTGDDVTCTQIVTVNDNQDPIITCPDDITVTVPFGETYTLPDYIANNDVTIFENCTLMNDGIQTPSANTLLSQGTYTIQFVVDDSSFNTGQCSFELTVEEVLGTVDLGLETITFYPNPTNENLNLSNLESTQSYAILLYDLLGNLVVQKVVEENVTNVSLNLEELAGGVYLLKLKNEDLVTITKKIVKQ